ncbi:MAG: EAL domain-containing protein, partial [Coriobacteriales bacterium]|nr:EAL domain-containing protein [Coriobacteriales bacterium]
THVSDPATHPDLDPITEVLTFSSFGKEYERILREGGHSHLALWLIDVHNFRSINRKYGYIRGNEALKAIARAITKTMCAKMPVARVAGDRFVALTQGFAWDKATDELDALIDYLEKDLLPSINIHASLVLSAGVYYLRSEDLEDHDPQRVLDYASIAHRKARSVPRSTVVAFTDEDLEADMRRIAIEQSIDEALASGHIQVWFQAQIDYTYGEIVGAEALSRWNHPELGWISPSEYIPILENCDKIHDLDVFVWEEACRCANRWRNMSDGKPVPISVNVSRSEMFEPGIMDRFLELHQKYDLPKGSLRLEVTENAFVEEANRLYSVVEKMRSNDMTVEMDDFGSGLSSLNMLKDVPVDVVKLDMDFIRSSVKEGRGGVVLGSVIRMLQGLDTPIIAEGVETLEQAEMLKNMGCHLMQGYHFSRPMPRDEFEKFISINRTVENTRRKSRFSSHLDELMSMSTSSSFLFNHVMGGTLFFFVVDGTTESILANDAFYAECGLERGEFGASKINPIAEITQETRATFWRAAAEAREHGSAQCVAEVRRSGRWIECVLRYLGTSARGDIYSINIVRSYAKGGQRQKTLQITQDIGWNIDLLNNIIPNGFVKCEMNESFHIQYLSPYLISESGLSQSEFVRRFHNSFYEAIASENRIEFVDAVTESKNSGKPFICDLNLYHGYGVGKRLVHVLGRVRTDDVGIPWVYLLLTFTGEIVTESNFDLVLDSARIIPFDYDFASDELVIHDPRPEGGARDYAIAGLTKYLDQMPSSVARSSVSKMLAIMRDLRTHPLAGFVDIKCNLRGLGNLRWYHVDYTCDVDAEGKTIGIRGYAQDANDQMGSALWWRRQAEIDQLTGLLNRNAVEQEINLSMRTEGSGMMFMIDLDGFKRINDDLGHLAGDSLLKDVASALSDCFPAGGLLGRYGGDEFVAFVPVMMIHAQEVAKYRANEIIKTVSQVYASDGTHAACSVGVAISNNPKATFYDLLEVADKAMYASKEGGKGRYTIMYA